MTNLPISELRCDPITGRKVLIAEDRAERPSDFTGLHVDEADPASCPFCVGHEGNTPVAALEVPDDQGGWRVRVIPNKYPAVRIDAAAAVRDESGALSLTTPQSSFGVHEVIVESSRHLRDVDEMTADELATVLGVYRDRLRHWSSDDRLQHAILFKNVGFAAGASLEHVHSQLVALPFVSEEVEAELKAAERYFQKHGQCIFCRLLVDERRLATRWVAEVGPFAAFCAYAGRQPYETWILPTEHGAQFHEIADRDIVSLATLMREVLSRLRQRLAGLSYNLILHTAPFTGTEEAAFHWHWELIPRTSRLAGLEWGTGVHINSLSPERAADLLRKTSL
jgi:UDPglucose--hexose-1-phosphate uridylyltransferase